MSASLHTLTYASIDASWLGFEKEARIAQSGLEILALPRLTLLWRPPLEL